MNNGVYALDDREAEAYASVHASNKRYQVAIDAWECVHRLWQVFPSLGSTCPKLATLTYLTGKQVRRVPEFIRIFAPYLCRTIQ